MREIIFDTETTGLDPKKGDRLVVTGRALKWVNRVQTGCTFHACFNPDRSSAAEAEAVLGLSSCSCRTSPAFHERAEELLEFIAESPLVAHNAGFDFSASMPGAGYLRG